MPPKKSLFPFSLIILFIVRRLKCPHTNYTKRQRHAQSACLFSNFHVFPAQENLSFQNPTTTKTTHPILFYPPNNLPTPAAPQKALNYGSKLTYFFILTKQRFENNVNSLLFFNFNIFELLTWRGNCCVMGASGKVMCDTKTHSYKLSQLRSLLYCFSINRSFPGVVFTPLLKWPT